MNEQVNHIILRSGREYDFLPPWRNYSSNLKQHALLFDQIGILRLGNISEVMSSALNLRGSEFDLIKQRFQTFISDIEWLEENNIIFEPKIEKEIITEDLQRIFQKNPIVASEIRGLSKIVKDKLGEQEPKDIFDKNNFILETDGILLRIISLVMGANRKISATTALPYTEYTHKLLNTNMSDVAQVVINKLPLPDGTTPWEKIIDYRDDAENQKSLLALL